MLCEQVVVLVAEFEVKIATKYFLQGSYKIYYKQQRK